MIGSTAHPSPAPTISLIASTLPSDITGFRVTCPRESHLLVIRLVFPPGSNSRTGSFDKAVGVTHAGNCISSGAITVNSSSITGVISSIRPDVGNVIRPISMVFSTTALTMSAVFPVLTVISRVGNCWRRFRRMGGNKKIHAVAPVPNRTRPISPVLRRAMASSESETAASMRLAWSSSSSPAAVGLALRPTRSIRRTPTSFSSWRI